MVEKNQTYFVTCENYMKFKIQQPYSFLENSRTDLF